MLSGVVCTMTKGALHHRAMDGVTLVVLSIILLPPGEDIIQDQFLLEIGVTGSGPTQGPHMVQGATAGAQLGVGLLMVQGAGAGA
ncbi:hypothetical protein NC651_016668 [Populus alba x Populus x berolinensis]|nr:hypothetical protein NC651_016668 [Populus alba x Populus x berolinensis]